MKPKNIPEKNTLPLKDADCFLINLCLSVKLSLNGVPIFIVYSK